MRSLTMRAASGRGRPRHLGAASGIVECGKRFYVIGDDEYHLAAFDRHGRSPGDYVRLLPGTLPAGAKQRKKAKPDFELLLALPRFAGHPHGALFALGSGSRRNRETGAVVPLDARGGIAGAPLAIDMRCWYAALRATFGELNLEGGFVDGTRLALLHRGNKGDRRNARLRVPLAPVLDALATAHAPPAPSAIDVASFTLGAIDGVPLAFTDGAALPDGGFAFTAVAEDTDDSYADGGCAGAAIGFVDAADRITGLWRLDPPWKVEGLALRPLRRGFTLRVVTDADDPSVPARLLEATLRRPSHD